MAESKSGEASSKPKSKAASKAASAPSTHLRFMCPRCKAKLKVSMKLAGRYMPCPKCQNKIPVPESQEEADAEGKPYDLSSLTYAIPKECRNCKAKLRKGSVVCTKCGFDYRTGKKLEFLDRTKRIGDEVTYKQIFNTPFQRDISNQTTDLLQGLVAVGSGFSTLFLIRWIVFAFLWTQVDEDVAHLVRRISNIALGLVITFLQGAFWFRSMVKACSLTALGVSTEMGGFFLNGLYCYLIRFVALLPLGLVFLLGYRSHELDYEAWLHSGPLVVAAVLAFIWNTIYVPMAVAAFAVDASINPLVVAYWFGRSFLDLLLLIGYFLLFYLLLWAPVLGFFGYLLYEFGDGGLMSIIIIFIAWNVYQILWGFTSVATYATLGLVLKKNSEW